MNDDSLVEPDAARATAFYVKSIALMLFAYLLASVGVALSVVFGNPLPVIAGGLVALFAIYESFMAYLDGGRHNRWTSVAADDED